MATEIKTQSTSLSSGIAGTVKPDVTAPSPAGK
jgi:hypothetical protein